jgi:hypothetical protein
MANTAAHSEALEFLSYASEIRGVAADYLETCIDLSAGQASSLAMIVSTNDPLDVIDEWLCTGLTY